MIGSEQNNKGSAREGIYRTMGLMRTRQPGSVGRALSWDTGDLGSVPCSAINVLCDREQVMLPVALSGTHSIPSGTELCQSRVKANGHLRSGHPGI